MIYKINNKLAFTLTELLLSVSLILCFLGAIIFNFSSKINKTKEAKIQFESLITLTKSTAAINGKTIQLNISTNNKIETIDKNNSSQNLINNINELVEIKAKTEEQKEAGEDIIVNFYPNGETDEIEFMLSAENEEGIVLNLNKIGILQPRVNREIDVGF